MRPPHPNRTRTGPPHRVTVCVNVPVAVVFTTIFFLIIQLTAFLNPSVGVVASIVVLRAENLGKSAIDALFIIISYSGLSVSTIYFLDMRDGIWLEDDLRC
jgi:hypothetical protein